MTMAVTFFPYALGRRFREVLWAQDKLRRGQLVSVAGYLTQRTVQRAEEALHCAEIVAEQFQLLKPPDKAK